ncbi:hypothetical protein M951_chr2118 (nucleomorph) [Lotharella oceanica]|uniref:Uncharacterized protein n=1 Tax=Lotharella oceanica TaxID=641309 RepID=A0A060DH30_9EUKA|nr:hypothetical protein M951_chr2118 [Lotharella oceanica]|mmetsp:Transcript_2837/g.5390  ORF Transcript_2837/g.5390 Transcript_2837/m.5390 type:complete len:145 (-) Transcript_2837:1480-1914(-)
MLSPVVLHIINHDQYYIIKIEKFITTMFKMQSIFYDKIILKYEKLEKNRKKKISINMLFIIFKNLKNNHILKNYKLNIIISILLLIGGVQLIRISFNLVDIIHLLFLGKNSRSLNNEKYIDKMEIYIITMLFISAIFYKTKKIV